MKLIEKIRKNEFELRIFISLSIVLVVYSVLILFFNHQQPLHQTLSAMAKISNGKLFYLFAAFFMILITILRMWAGSMLSSKRVMSFRIQIDRFIMDGPYTLVRNPIYFADWIAMCLFSLFLPALGLLIPILFYFHYMQLIIYEEQSFIKQESYNYLKYLSDVPRLIPTRKSIAGFIKSRHKVSITKDGIRHNGLYLLFIPGFLVGYLTDSFLYVVIIGMPAVIDWAVIHTKIGLPKKSKKTKSKVFNSVLYSQCWEDPQLDRTAFNINENDVVISITSGGCNVLAFLVDNPRKIIAIDLNPNQNYLLELKIAAYRLLNYNQLLEFLGVKKSTQRLEYFNLIKHKLSVESLEYWEGHIKYIRQGIIHCGRFENYIKLLRVCLRILIGRKNINQLFLINDEHERKELYHNKWENLRWKYFTKILLSRKMMSYMFDQGFFKYLKEDFSFGKHFAEKTKKAITELPVKENYFLTYILLGNYFENHLPDYLKPVNYGLIKSRLDRIKIISGNCYDYFIKLEPNSISKINFTNIFEWMSEEDFELLLKETIRIAKDGAVITYRNLLVQREHPENLSDYISSNKELAKKLHDRDLSFIYKNYVIEKICKIDKICVTESLQYQEQKS